MPPDLDWGCAVRGPAVLAAVAVGCEAEPGPVDVDEGDDAAVVALQANAFRARGHGPGGGGRPAERDGGDHREDGRPNGRRAKASNTGAHRASAVRAPEAERAGVARRRTRRTVD